MKEILVDGRQLILQHCIQMLQDFRIALHCLSSTSRNQRAMLTEPRPRRNESYWRRTGMRMIEASARADSAGLGNQLHATIAALVQILIDYRLRGVCAAPAAAAHRKLVLHVKKRARTPIDTLADVFISHGMAYADVHQSPSLLPGTYGNWE
jgi:hypothetical protein